MKLSMRLKQIANSIRTAYGDKNLIIGEDFWKLIQKLCYINDDIHGKIPISELTEIIPQQEDYKIKGGSYLLNDVTVKGDENLKSENILRGRNNQKISIFGVDGSLDMVRRFNDDLNTNEYYGGIVSDVARSYHVAKLNGVSFKYHDGHGILRDGLLTDENGNCYLDCSSFISLVLRGIPFNKSPYASAYGKPNQKATNSDIHKLTLNSKYTWANKYLDMQTDEYLKDIGVRGFRSISNAAQIAEYYFGKGRTLYEFKESPSSIPEGLKPGDLIFWSKESANDKQKSRFKAISHVGVVSRDIEKFIHVTGSNDEKGDTVFYSDLAGKLNEISLIVRPNYQPVSQETPLETNLLTSWGYDNCNVSSSYTTKGVQFKPLIDGGFTITRTSDGESGASFYLHKSDNPIRLTPGIYEISGCPLNEDASSYRKTRDWGIMVKNVNGEKILNNEDIEVLDKGNGDTFTITKDTDVYIVFYCSSSLSPSGLVCKPVLKKKSRVKRVDNDNSYIPPIETPSSGNTWREGYISNDCMSLLKGWEGYYDHAYKDSEGYWTIGYGITLHAEPDVYNKLKAQTPVSEEECAKALYNTVRKNYGLKVLPIAQELGVTNQKQFDAMVSLAYSMGYGVWTNRKSTIYKTIKEDINNHTKIKEVWERTAITGASTGNVLPGLVKRRKAEAQVFCGETVEPWAITKYTKVNGVLKAVVFNGAGWLPNK